MTKMLHYLLWRSPVQALYANECKRVAARCTSASVACGKQSSELVYEVCIYTQCRYPHPSVVADRSTQSRC